jgi:hypothetical protein
MNCHSDALTDIQFGYLFKEKKDRKGTTLKEHSNCQLPMLSLKRLESWNCKRLNKLYETFISARRDNRLRT